MDPGDSRPSAARGGLTRWEQAAFERPEWIDRLGVAVWVSGPDHTLAYCNERAEELLGLSRTECLGLPCYRVVSGKDAAGRRVCGPDCPIARLARSGEPIEPLRLRLGGAGRTERWIQVLTITLRASDGRDPWLVHCAQDVRGQQRIEQYLERVATRTHASPAPPVTLTDRENEILRLLAEDQTLHAIAVEIGVTYSTVRNHVQHILAKLGVHSTMEAIARYLLVTDGSRRARRPGA